MNPLTIDESSYLLVLTGAGISAESGIPTFRAGGGLWESHPVEEVASPRGFAKDPALVWRFYSERRKGVSSAAPNRGHACLAAVEAKLGERFLLATQNVDGLHHRAGSQRLIEMHGSLQKTRCTVCDREPFVDDDLYMEKLPMCGACDKRGKAALLRPHIVWFGEMLDPAHLRSIDGFMHRAGKKLIFLAVGTSGAVYPAAGLVDAARSVGGSSVLVNLDAADNTKRFDEFHQGASGEVLPALFADLLS